MPIRVHLSIDQFDGDLMMKTDEPSLEYAINRMLPPGMHRYFYSVDGEPCVAQD